MSVIVRIPSPFQQLTGGREEVQAAPDSIMGIIEQLEHVYPGLRERLTNGGRIRSYINIFVNEDDIRFLKAGDTQVNDGDEVTIIPAISGGSRGTSFLTLKQEALRKRA
jgi:sulfur-carrier protein